VDAMQMASAIRTVSESLQEKPQTISQTSQKESLPSG